MEPKRTEPDHLDYHFYGTFRPNSPPSPKSGASWSLSCCPIKGQLFKINRHNPSQRFRLWCDANTCLYCAMRKVDLLAEAIAKSRPTHLVTLTHLPGGWADARPKIEALRRHLTRPHPFDWTYTLEPNRRSPGSHLHAWVHGRDVPTPDQWKRAAIGVGFGRMVDVTPARPSRSLWYSFKTVRGLQTLHRDDAQTTLEAFVTLNGGRFAHSSRRFFRDERGASIKGGMNKAIEQVARDGVDQPDWEVVHEKHLAAYEARWAEAEQLSQQRPDTHAETSPTKPSSPRSTP